MGRRSTTSIDCARFASQCGKRPWRNDVRGHAARWRARGSGRGTRPNRYTMRIALFDYLVTSDNAIGKCDLAILSALCDEHDFTVFSSRFENPRPDRIRWVRVPAPPRPMVLLYVIFHLTAPLVMRGISFATGCASMSY